MTQEQIESLVLDFLTDPFNPNEVTKCPAQRYRRRTRDLNRQSLKSRPRRMFRGMC